MFITMIFAYYLLARAEERECELKFGQSYIDYKAKTGMFLPFRLPFAEKAPVLPNSKLVRFFSVLALYVMILLAGLGLARGLNNYALNSLYASYSGNSVYVSVSRIDQEKLQNIIEIAEANPEVNTRLNKVRDSQDIKFLNYVLPSEWYVPEIPMNGRNGVVEHTFPSNYNKNLYKIIFTKAELRTNSDVKGKDIILNVVQRIPLAEVWIDAANHKVVKVLEMPAKIMYDYIPVAVY